MTKDITQISLHVHQCKKNSADLQQYVSRVMKYHHKGSNTDVV